MASALKAIPGVGNLASGVEAAYYGVRGAMADDPGERNKYLSNAAMSAAGMIPVVGNVINAVNTGSELLTGQSAGDLLGGAITSLTSDGGGAGGGAGAQSAAQ